jgi:hypothetical protein
MCGRKVSGKKIHEQLIWNSHARVHLTNNLCSLLSTQRRRLIDANEPDFTEVIWPAQIRHERPRAQCQRLFSDSKAAFIQTFLKTSFPNQTTNLSSSVSRRVNALLTTTSIMNSLLRRSLCMASFSIELRAALNP